MVLDQDSNWNPLLCKKAYYIKLLSPSLNKGLKPAENSAFSPKYRYCFSFSHVYYYYVTPFVVFKSTIFVRYFSLMMYRVVSKYNQIFHQTCILFSHDILGWNGQWRKCCLAGHCHHLQFLLLKVVFHSRMKFFSLSWTEIVFAPLHRPSSNDSNYTFG